MAKPTPWSASSANSVDSAELTQYLTFWLGSEVFGLEIRAVREIIQCRPITSLPLIPEFVRGVINLRGSVVPVIDLNARFGRAPATLGKKTCIVIFDATRGNEHVELGMLVDAVSEVIKIAASDIEPPPDFGSVVRRDFIHGIAKLESRFVVLLDPDRALDVTDMAQLCEAGHAEVVA